MNKYNMKFVNKYKLHWVCFFFFFSFFLWLHSFIARVFYTQLFIFRAIKADGVDFTQCVTHGSFRHRWQETAYNMFHFVTLYVFPLLVMTFCYTRILTKINGQMRKSKGVWPLGWVLTNVHAGNKNKLLIDSIKVYYHLGLECTSDNADILSSCKRLERKDEHTQPIYCKWVALIKWRLISDSYTSPLYWKFKTQLSLTP